MARKLFCEISPFCYKISTKKEILKKKLKDLFGKEKIARTHYEALLPMVVKEHSSVLIRRLHGVDLTLQENKVTNIRLACEKINKLTIKPGETFSFWNTVGATTAKKGYKPVLIISKGNLGSGIGGGMCQMANLIHWMVLNSPFDVTELHHHSDALFPDAGRKVPFGTGTSVCYNYIDYRFKNNTDRPVQIVVWIEEGELKGELRTTKEFPYTYRLTEENHHFRKEGAEYYRISQVYRFVSDRKTGEELRKELILDNHSKVLYDHALIPKEEIR